MPYADPDAERARRRRSYERNKVAILKARKEARRKAREAGEVASWGGSRRGPGRRPRLADDTSPSPEIQALVDEQRRMREAALRRFT